MKGASPKLYCALVGSSLVSYGSNTEVESKTILSSSTSALEPSGKVDDNFSPVKTLKYCDIDPLPNPVCGIACSSSKRNPCGIRSSVACSSCMPSWKVPPCSWTIFSV